MTGLRKPSNKDLAIGASTIEETINTWSTDQQVRHDLESSYGVSFKYQPPSAPEPSIVAADLTKPDSTGYTELYVNVNNWWAFYAEVLASIRVDVKQFQNTLDLLEAQARDELRKQNKNLNREDRLSQKEIDDAILTNPALMEVRLKLQKAEQQQMLLAARVETYERNLKLISRQVEIRRLDHEQTMVGGNMPGRKGGPPPSFRTR